MNKITIFSFGVLLIGFSPGLGETKSKESAGSAVAL
jgi:hypothetical protein